MNSVVHFEIPADDMKRAKDFYQSLFGWQTQDFGGDDFFLVMTTESDDNGPKNPGAINGDIFSRHEKNKALSIVINVDLIDEFLPKIETAGGKVLQSKTAMGDTGSFASFQDTEGNVLGLWENTK